jgi:uncharacterized protein YggE
MRYYGAVVIAALAGVASAAPARAQTRQNCQTETAQISVNFNGTERDVAAAKATIDAKTAEIKALAEDQGFTKFEIQSHNININSNANRNTSGDPMVQYNGNTSFTVVPADKAVEFMSLLVKRGYRVSVNINSYNNGSCSQS